MASRSDQHVAPPCSPNLQTKKKTVYMSLSHPHRVSTMLVSSRTGNGEERAEHGVHWSAAVLKSCQVRIL